jgi:hypothetical protein
MKNSLRLCLVALSVAALALVGCGGHPWKVVSQTAPNPFDNAAKFTLEAPDFTHLTQGKWAPDIQPMQEAYASGYSDERGPLGVASAPADGFIVKTEITKVEAGVMTGFVNIPTELHARVTVTNAQGTALDTFTVAVAEQADLTQAASGTRFKHAAEHLGKITAQYLKFREGLDQ